MPDVDPYAPTNEERIAEETERSMLSEETWRLLEESRWRRGEKGRRERSLDTLYVKVLCSGCGGSGTTRLLLWQRSCGVCGGKGFLWAPRFRKLGEIHHTGYSEMSI